MKKVFSILLITITICFVGCARIKFLFTEQDVFFAEQQKSITLAENFCFALSDDDIEIAEGYLHPDSPLCDGNLVSFLSTIEQENGIDFSRGVTFRDRELIEAYANTSNDPADHQGYTFIFYLEVVIDGKITKLSFEMVYNEKGCGVYSFEKYIPKG